MDIFQKVNNKILNRGQMVYDHKSKIVIKTISDQNFPFFISFPRTGSHWIRHIMELYFKQPSLTRIFYYKGKTNYLLYHTHDLKNEYSLDTIQRKNVIYLYRNIPETIYSQMQYYKENLMDNKRVIFWTGLYGKHLKKWLIDENFTQRKAVLKYENFKNNLSEEFKKICLFFDKTLDAKRLNKINGKITKLSVSLKTSDRRVINIATDYEKLRENFLKENKQKIYNQIFIIEPKLVDYFN